MGSKRLTPTRVGKMASKCLFVVVVVVVVVVGCIRKGIQCKTLPNLLCRCLKNICCGDP